VRLPAAALVVAEQFPDTDPQKPILLDYKKQFEAKYGPVSTFGGHAYDGLMIVVAAIERAGGTDKAKVRDEIEKTHGFIGTAGVFNMTPTDHMGLNLDAFKMVEIRDGAGRSSNKRRRCPSNSFSFWRPGSRSVRFMPWWGWDSP
jgi:branched-chain amino acid transport system substrate-binding protein